MSNALGDDAGFEKKTRKVDEDGKVITAPRNFFTTKTKTGRVENVYFSRGTFNAVGDPFKQVGLQTMGRSADKEGYLKAGHDKPFKPAKDPGVKVPKAPYEYKEQGPPPKKNYRDEDKNVIVGPKNILTNPMKEGKIGKNIYFDGKIDHMADDYDAAKKLAIKEREYHETKVQDKPFCPRAKHTDLFNKAREVYEENPPIPPKKEPEAPAAPAEPLHDKPFKPANPSKKGYKSTLNKFPEWLPNPAKQLVRVKKEEGEEEMKGFKATYKERTRPTPSVATNIRNLKASYPTLFRR